MKKHRGNIKKYISGGVSIFVLLAVLFATPAAAQSPTVTPFPGPALTATAAAYNMTRAQQQQQQGAQMKAEAAAQRARAAQLEQQGNDAISQGQASYSSAAQDATAAAAALQAQQIGIANEFIARAQSNIEAGRGQIDAARNAISQLRLMVDVQAGTIISLTNRVQQAEMNVQTINNAYQATISQQEKSQRESTIDSIFTGLLIIAFLIVLVALVAQVIRSRRDSPEDTTAPPIEAEYTVENESDLKPE